MIIRQPTDSSIPASGTMTQLAALEALHSLLAQYPMLPPVAWSLDCDEPEKVNANVPRGAVAACTAFHDALGGHLLADSAPRLRKNGKASIGASWFGNWAGLSLYLFGSDPVDAFTAFALDHNPDPQEWPAPERTEYAEYARQYAGVA